jgi:hypothetical protein
VTATVKFLSQSLARIFVGRMWTFPYSVSSCCFILLLTIIAEPAWAFPSDGWYSKWYRVEFYTVSFRKMGFGRQKVVHFLGVQKHFYLLYGSVCSVWWEEIHERADGGKRFTSVLIYFY